MASFMFLCYTKNQQKCPITNIIECVHSNNRKKWVKIADLVLKYVIVKRESFKTQ